MLVLNARFHKATAPRLKRGVAFRSKSPQVTQPMSSQGRTKNPCLRRYTNRAGTGSPPILNPTDRADVYPAVA